MSKPVREDTLWAEVVRVIGDHLGKTIDLVECQSVGGGCISAASIVDTDVGPFFVKIGDTGSLEMFEAEVEGLRELGAPTVIGVPRPVCTGVTGSVSFIATEAVSRGPSTVEGFRLLGQQLAALHRVEQARYGWKRDNFIGLTGQPNTWHEHWPTFFRESRLAFQLRLAATNEYPQNLQSTGEQLLKRLHVLFDGYAVQPSLLHGDLWSGNFMIDPSGKPYIFDPAVYYGDREADIAMTELFGGFPDAFYQAYNASWPLDSGYHRRKPLYQLYHVLNHANLFGGSYIDQAAHLIRRLLVEIG